MTDFRALCAELLEAIDDLPWQYDWKGNPVGPLAEVDDAPFERASAALAQPEPQGPTDEEIEAAARVIYGSMRFDRISYTKPWVERGNSFAQDEARRCARAVLTRWGCPAIEPQKPTNGFIAWCLFDPDGQLRPEAIEVLTACQLMPPTPVPVAERLPGPEDCDGEGWCWWWNKDELSWTKGLPEYCAGSYGPWLPHHALPVPQLEAGQ
jgi:hypothetical protein